MYGLIVGENSSGKTVYLEKLVEKLGGFRKVLSNMKDPIFYKNIPFDVDKLEILDNLTDIDFMGTQGTSYLLFQSNAYNLSIDFVILVSLVFKKGSVLILDEPDKQLTETEIMLFVDILNKVKHKFKVILIVSHRDTFLALSRFKVFTIALKTNEKIVLRKATKKEIYEYTN